MADKKNDSDFDWLICHEVLPETNAELIYPIDRLNYLLANEKKALIEIFIKNDFVLPPNALEAYTHLCLKYARSIFNRNKY